MGKLDCQAHKEWRSAAPSRGAGSTPHEVFEHTMRFSFDPVPACHLCGNPERVKSGVVCFEGDIFAYSMCTQCGLKYMDPCPSTEFYREYYAQEFWESKLEGRSWEGDIDFTPVRAEGYYERRYRDVKQFLTAANLLRPGLRVLEVGCSFGKTLSLLRDRDGCEVFGIEPSEAARNDAAGRAGKGIKFVGTHAEDLANETDPQTFDLIAFFHVLENVVEPIPVLQTLHQHLAPGGHLIVITPNLDFNDLMNPYHPFIFSPETLRLLFHRGGFVPVFEEHSSPQDISKLNPRPDMILLGRSDPGHPIPPIAQVDVDDLLRRQQYASQTWAQLPSKELLRLIGARLLAKLFSRGLTVAARDAPHRVRKQRQYRLNEWSSSTETDSPATSSQS